MGNKNLILCLIVLAGSILYLPADAVKQEVGEPSTLAQLKAAKLKALCRRAARIEDLIPELEKKLAISNTRADQRRLEYLDLTIMTASGLAGNRLDERIELIEAMGSAGETLTAAELSALQDRYAHLCAEMDSRILRCDLESVLRLHDRFIGHMNLGLWSKEKASAELERLIELVASAPEIPYGRLELLRSLKDKRLSPPAAGCYSGVWSDHQLLLSGSRLSASLLEAGTGATIVVEIFSLAVPGSDGKLADLNALSSTSEHPFRPPLTLWLKSRLLEGRIPAIVFDITCVQDVLEGKLDDYLKRNFQLIASSQAAVLIGIFKEFDRQPAACAFGADGRTPYYLLIDKKLAAQPVDRHAAFLDKQLKRGSYINKTDIDLYIHYKNESIPDGPERVRDAWRHIRELVKGVGAENISLFSSAGEFHGSSQAYSIAGQQAAGIQKWNELRYYWPGEGIIDWIATAAKAGNAHNDSQADNLTGAIGSFMSEVATSQWQGTPVLLDEVAPSFGPDPFLEGDWIVRSFQSTIQRDYPQIKLFCLRFPDRISLWSADALSAFRIAVSSNRYFNPPLTLTPATP